MPEFIAKTGRKLRRPSYLKTSLTNGAVKLSGTSSQKRLIEWARQAIAAAIIGELATGGCARAPQNFLSPASSGRTMIVIESTDAAVRRVFRASLRKASVSGIITCAWLSQL